MSWAAVLLLSIVASHTCTVARESAIVNILVLFIYHSRLQNKFPNVQVCDATGDAMENVCWAQKNFSNKQNQVSSTAVINWVDYM